jgi:hypothetical protein
METKDYLTEIYEVAYNYPVELEYKTSPYRSAHLAKAIYHDYITLKNEIE